ncbi:MAG: GTPase, partial [Myxococcota bacterium]
YTNAGKSTLLNQLTSSEVLSEDKLFATLRPTSRRLELHHGRTIIFTDTVGFIHDLPEELVNAFKATLEELAEADLLLHVADISDPEFMERVDAVARILGDLEIGEKEQMLVLNKRDRIDDEAAKHLERRFGALAVSALERATLQPLIERVDRRLRAIERARVEAATTSAQA